MLNAFVITRNTPEHDRPEFLTLAIDGSHDDEPRGPYYWTSDLDEALVFVDGQRHRKVIPGGVALAERTLSGSGFDEGSIVPIDKARFDVGLAHRKTILEQAEREGVSIVERG